MHVLYGDNESIAWPAVLIARIWHDCHRPIFSLLSGMEAFSSRQVFRRLAQNWSVIFVEVLSNKDSRSCGEHFFQSVGVIVVRARENIPGLDSSEN